jgi:hypothetical protein
VTGMLWLVYLLDLRACDAGKAVAIDLPMVSAWCACMYSQCQPVREALERTQDVVRCCWAHGGRGLSVLGVLSSGHH